MSMVGVRNPSSLYSLRLHCSGAPCALDVASQQRGVRVPRRQPWLTTPCCPGPAAHEISLLPSVVRRVGAAAAPRRRHVAQRFDGIDEPPFTTTSSARKRASIPRGHGTSCTRARFMLLSCTRNRRSSGHGTLCTRARFMLHYTRICRHHMSSSRNTRKRHTSFLRHFAWSFSLSLLFFSR